MTDHNNTCLRWHSQSRLFLADGSAVPCPTGSASTPDWIAVPDTPAAQVLPMIFPASNAVPGFCVHAPGHPPTSVPPTGRHPRLGCLTSGTTGQPKLILRSQASWCASFRINCDLWQITPADTYATLGALSHSLSLYAACEAFFLGADLHLLTGQRPDRQAARLREANITILYATPAQLRQIVTSGPSPLPSLRLILIGGSKLDLQTRDALEALAPSAAIHEFYGASETSFITITDSDTPTGSVGHAYPGVTLSICGPNGTPLPTDETGEIWVESPYLFDGYAEHDEPQTQRRGNAISVGEVGRLDANGNLWLAGRQGRMITIADQNVFPEEVESCLLTLPGITRAAVLPRPDTKRGHILVACIEATTTISDDAILTHCRTALGPLKAPRQILRPVPFPTLASGKPDLQALGSQLQESTT